MTKPMYHPHAPGPLMERLCITFPLHGRGFVSYPRQEAPMRQLDAHAQLDALRRAFVEDATFLRTLIQMVEAQERQMTARWEQIMALETAQRGCPHGVGREQG